MECLCPLKRSTKTQWDTSLIKTNTTLSDFYGRICFMSAKAFNQDIGNWNTSQVTSMASMFYYADAFNQDIGRWNTSQVTTMSSMLGGSYSVQPRHWELGHIASDFYGKYVYSASEFNHDIGNWNTSQVASMSSMFYYACSFNQDIGSWNTEKVAGYEIYVLFSRMFFSVQPRHWALEHR